jgi:hypothetical protein
MIRAWKRFDITADSEKADFVVQVNMYAKPYVWNNHTQKEELRDKPLPGCELWLWPHGADPENDALLWEEMYWPKWFQPERVVLSTCVERLWKDIQDAVGAPIGIPPH